MHVNNTNEKCSFRQPMFYCELHYRNTQPHLNLEIRKQSELVKSECLCVTLLIVISKAGTRQDPWNTRLFLTCIILIISVSFTNVFQTQHFLCVVTDFRFVASWLPCTYLWGVCRRLIHGTMYPHQPADLENLKNFSKPVPENIYVFLNVESIACLSNLCRQTIFPLFPLYVPWVT